MCLQPAGSKYFFTIRQEEVLGASVDTLCTDHCQRCAQITVTVDKLCSDHRRRCAQITFTVTVHCHCHCHCLCRHTVLRSPRLQGLFLLSQYISAAFLYLSTKMWLSFILVQKCGCPSSQVQKCGFSSSRVLPQKSCFTVGRPEEITQMNDV